MKIKLSSFCNEQLSTLKYRLFDFSDFLIALCMTTLMALLLFFSNYFNTGLQKDFIGTNILCIVTMMLVLFFICLFKNKTKLSLNIDVLVKYLVVLFFIIQLYIFYNIFFESGWDVRIMRETARALTYHNESPFDYYFRIYPNNMFLTSLCTLIFKLNHAIGVFSGEYFSFCLVVVNCLISSATSYLTYCVMKKLFNQKYAFAGYLLVVGLIILSPWNVIFYSDSVGLLFPILILYVFLNKKLSVYPKYILIFVLGYIGYRIKPQCIIIVVAILFCIGIQHLGCINKQFIKKSLIVLFCAGIAVLGVDKSITTLNENNNLIKDNESQFGITHFLMMGLNDEYKGIYSEEDVEFSKSYPTFHERKQANLTESTQRIRSLGLKGMINLLCHKALINFNDGTFAWEVEGTFYHTMYDNINSIASPFLKNIYYSKTDSITNNGFKYYSSFTQFLWINILFFIFIKTIMQLWSKRKHKNKKIDFNYQVILLALFGLTLFELIFEARARYLYTYIPLFIIAAMYGLNELIPLIKSKINQIRPVFNRL